MATRARPPGDTAAPTELIGPPAPPPEEPPPDRELWPWLVVLLVLVVAGLAAAWFATRDSGSATPQTVQTTVPAAGAEPTAKPKKKPQTTTAVGQVGVPDLVGQQRDDAAGTLQAQGLSASVNEVPSTQEVGIVVAQQPHGGTNVDKGSSVTLNVSKGPSKPPEPTTVTVPSVVGQSVDSAAGAVKGAGLHPSVQHVPSTEAEGTVVSQSPSGGSSAQRGAGVLLNVSSGPAQTKAKPEKKEKASKAEQKKEKKSNESQQQSASASVPSVVGEDAGTAAGDLQSAGFSVSTVDQPTSDPSEDGMVVDQSPPGGSSEQPNSTVTIYVGRFDSG